jgi:hypothetical protein
MMTTEMLRKLERRQFDKIDTRVTPGKRVTNMELRIIFELADAGLSNAEIAARVGMTLPSVKYRLATYRGGTVGRPRKRSVANV